MIVLMVLAAMGVVLAPAAEAWTTNFTYYCYTYVQTGGHQADRYAHGDWYWSGSGIRADDQTTGAPSSYYDNNCNLNYSYVVEASVFMRPEINGVLQQTCAFGYSGYGSGVAYASATCHDNYIWTSMRVEMGHRAWFSGSYYDDYPVAIMVY